MVLCAAVGCNNDSRRVKGIGYYKLLKRSDTHQRQWLAKLKRGNFVPTAHTVVCGDHFEGHCFQRDLQAELLSLTRPRQLTEDAVPTIFQYVTDAKKRSRNPSEWQENKRRKKVIDEILANVSTETATEAPVHITEDLPSARTSTSVQTDHIIFPAITKDPVRAKKLVTASTQTEITVSSCQGTQYSPLDFQPNITLEHNYSSEKTYLANSPHFDLSSPQVGHLYKTSTPCKVKLPPRTCIAMDDGEDSFSDMSLHDRTADSDVTNEDISMYIPESSSSYSTDSSTDSLVHNSDSTPQDDKKYIVFESCLLELLRNCQKCGKAVIHQEKTVKGSLLKICTYCADGHNFEWFSQPSINRMAAGTLLFAASILFTGTTYTQLRAIADCLKLQLFSEKTYHSIQDSLLFPVVHQEWKTLQYANLQEVKLHGERVWLGGDGRCDSPGYNAKYCTYTMMDLDTGRVLDFSVNHVSEVKYSVNMEKLGFQKCLSRLKDEVDIEVIATDRHTQIKKLMKEHKDIIHQFDVWHMAKAVSKKLSAAAKHKGCDELSAWIPAIVNWFWYCTSSCQGDAVLLKDKWLSVLHHSVGTHQWNSGEKYHACEHPPLTPEQVKKKKFLKKGSAAHGELQKIVLDKRFLKDMEKLNLFCHTGGLEVYHSLMLKYAPKRQHFSMKGMVARTALTILDQEENLNRDIATAKQGPTKGQQQFSQVFSKKKKEWTVRPVYEAKTFHFRERLVEQTVKARMEQKKFDRMTIQDNLPQNIATKPKPTKSEAISAHRTRMKLCV